MNNNWFTISDFPFNPNFHYELFQLFMDGSSKLLLRKDSMEFEDLDEDAQAEIIEDNFKLYMEEILHFNFNETKQILDKEIKKSLVESDVILSESGRLHDLLNCLDDDETLYSIKGLITEKINGSDKMGTVFQKEALRFRNIEDSSFQVNEDEKQYFDWYEVSQNKLYQALNSQGLYNIIITKDMDNFENYNYYVNYVEGEEFILAISDNIGNFKEEIVPKIREAFPNKFEIKTDI